MLPIMTDWETPAGSEHDFKYQPVSVYAGPDDELIGHFPVWMLDNLVPENCRNNVRITGTADTGKRVVTLWLRPFDEVYRKAWEAAQDGLRIEEIELWHYEPLESSRGYYVQCQAEQPIFFWVSSGDKWQ